MLYSYSFITLDRSYQELLPCLVSDEDENVFVDSEWILYAQVQTVESIDEFPTGYRDATLYQSKTDPKQVSMCENV